MNRRFCYIVRGIYCKSAASTVVLQTLELRAGRGNRRSAVG